LELLADLHSRGAELVELPLGHLHRTHAALGISGDQEAGLVGSGHGMKKSLWLRSGNQKLWKRGELRRRIGTCTAMCIPPPRFQTAPPRAVFFWPIVSRSARRTLKRPISILELLADPHSGAMPGLSSSLAVICTARTPPLASPVIRRPVL